MSITEQLAKLPKGERLKCMEALWDTLRSEDVEAPAWHGKVLEARKAALDDGRADFISAGELRDRVRTITGK